MLNKKVVILLGGESPEREISFLTGNACYNSLIKFNHDVIKIDPDHNLISTLKEISPDVVFNALHGKWGEDGNIQAILEYLHIPYTHSGVFPSSNAINKNTAKNIFKSSGIPVAQGFILNKKELIAGNIMKPPYVIKPISGGSSIGIEIIYDEEFDLKKIVRENKLNDFDTYLVEEYIAGKDLTCAVMGSRVLGVTEIIPNSNFYNYESKYKSDSTIHIIPANIERNIYQATQELALAAHESLHCRGVTRCDFRFDDALGREGLVCLEINTQPGMTERSLVPELAKHEGISFDELVYWILNDASCNR